MHSVTIKRVFSSSSVHPGKYPNAMTAYLQIFALSFTITVPSMLYNLK